MSIGYEVRKPRFQSSGGLSDIVNYTENQISRIRKIYNFGEECIENLFGEYSDLDEVKRKYDLEPVEGLEDLPGLEVEKIDISYLEESTSEYLDNLVR